MKGRRISYSDAELAWLRSNRTMVISDYHAGFVAAFGRSDVTAVNLHQLRKRMRWLIGQRIGRTRGRHRLFSAAELVWLQANAGLVIDEYRQQFCSIFGRPDVTREQLNSLRKRMGWKTGRTGRFEKGHVSANKGQKMPYNANSARTRFRKGQLPHNYRGAGHESVDKFGYVWIVVAEINPWTGAATRRIHKHRWLWERLNGPVPVGMVLKCIDGNRANVEPSNWELVPQGLLPRLNGKSGRNYDLAPAELKPTIMAVAKLEHRLKVRP